MVKGLRAVVLAIAVVGLMVSVSYSRTDWAKANSPWTMVSATSVHQVMLIGEQSYLVDEQVFRELQSEVDHIPHTLVFNSRTGYKNHVSAPLRSVHVGGVGPSNTHNDIVIRLSPKEADNQFAVWADGSWKNHQVSPDGETIALTDAIASNIYLIDRITAEVTPMMSESEKAAILQRFRSAVTEEQPYLVWAQNPQWSPDGKWIAFESNRNGSPEVNTLTSVWIVERSGENPNELISSAPKQPKRLVGWNSEEKLVVWDVASSTLEIYTPEGQKVSSMNIAGGVVPSPNGDWLAVGHGSGSSVKLISTRQENTTVIVPVTFDSGPGQWSTNHYAFWSYLPSKDGVVPSLVVAALEEGMVEFAPPISGAAFDLTYPITWTNTGVLVRLTNGQVWHVEVTGRDSHAK